MNNDSIIICKNNGICINYCFCNCTKNGEIDHNICSCHHKNHHKNENYYYGFCPSNHCKLIQCINFKYCNLKRPQYELKLNNKYCNFCSIYLNKYLKLDIIQYCNHCKINENLVLLKCNHKICYNCLVNEKKCIQCKNIFPFCKRNNKICSYKKYKCKICNTI